MANRVRVACFKATRPLAKDIIALMYGVIHNYFSVARNCNHRNLSGLAEADENKIAHRPNEEYSVTDHLAVISGAADLFSQPFDL